MQFVDVIGQNALSNGSGGLALARAYAQYLHCTDRTKENLNI